MNNQLPPHLQQLMNQQPGMPGQQQIIQGQMPGQQAFPPGYPGPNPMNPMTFQPLPQQHALGGGGGFIDTVNRWMTGCVISIFIILFIFVGIPLIYAWWEIFTVGMAR